MGTWGTFLQKDFMLPKLFLPKQIFLYPKGGTSIFLKDPTFPRQAAEKIIFWKPSLKTFNQRLPSDFSGKHLTVPLNVIDKPPATHLKYPAVIPVAFIAMGDRASSAVQTYSALKRGDVKHAHQKIRHSLDYDMRDANKDPTDQTPCGLGTLRIMDIKSPLLAPKDLRLLRLLLHSEEEDGGPEPVQVYIALVFKESVLSLFIIFQVNLSSITDKTLPLFDSSVAGTLEKTLQYK